MLPEIEDYIERTGNALAITLYPRGKRQVYDAVTHRSATGRNIEEAWSAFAGGIGGPLNSKERRRMSYLSVKLKGAAPSHEVDEYYSLRARHKYNGPR